MTDSKISQLPDAGDALPTDDIVVVRGGVTSKANPNFLAAQNRYATAKLLGVPCIIEKSSSSITSTGTTSVVAMKIVDIPAGLLTTGGFIIVNSLWGFTTGAGTKDIRIRVGGAAGAQYKTFTNITATNASALLGTYVFALSDTSQTSAGPATIATTDRVASNATSVTSTVDTTAAWDIRFTCQLSDATDVATLVSYYVEIYQ